MLVKGILIGIALTLIIEFVGLVIMSWGSQHDSSSDEIRDWETDNL